MPRRRGAAPALALALAGAGALAGALAGARAQAPAPAPGAEMWEWGNATGNATFNATLAGNLELSGEPAALPPSIWKPAVNPYDGDYADPSQPNGPPPDWSWLNRPLAKRTGALSTEAALKSFLGIGNKTLYDVTSYPFEQMWAAKGQTGSNRTGLDIGVSINFHRVYRINQVTSEADLSVWLQEKWYDPRLVWDPADWNGTDTLYVWAGYGGTSGEIWVPEIELWNAVSSPQKTFSMTYAQLKSNGRVVWSRPGRLQVMCNFKGLENYPFDELYCRAELGSWLLSGEYIRPLPMNGVGWTVGGSSTAGQRFEQFKMSSVHCMYHEYDEANSDGVALTRAKHPVLWYDIEFTRAWRPHVLTFVVIQIILNILSFSVFWLPGSQASRIGMGITAMLTGVTNQLVMERQLPPAQAWTWASRFSVISMSFTALSLIESVCVHYFFFLRESDLTPLLFSVFGVSLCCGSVPKHHEMSPDALKNSLSSRHAWDSSLWKDPNCGDGNRKNAEEFLNRIEEENNRYWQKVARWIDEFSRWVIPPAYVVCVAIMLGTQKYRLDEGLIKGPTYEGYKSDPSINITAPGPTS